ncbi:biotin--[acetyl-CoA-carboxylase] ligase [Thermogemmatispora sp.]|uniref:biotin--[acetyl-CoA-carboxylase] ligase n=1 Tax=Thermogemmatispora sp. TaxID=1968838 RepID=UPI001DC4EAFB|nr:biotin--[acetyl-CoA-carboxylase] ligase [Thermogemmatispora sp.]MBX5450803.1 biotin--[acetyl-CoA-carboxylase] ligase [Thermogemmatispora sp.]
MTGSERLHLDRLRQVLGTRLIGRGEACLLYLPVVDSTNTLAMQRAIEAGPGESVEGLVVLTESQTAGRGRQGRRWVDVAGRNVLLSMVLYPRFPLPLLTMFSALAVLEAIADTAGLVATIKWPNDILIGERKVAGILIETSSDRAGRLVAVLGIGVNVNGRSEDLAIEQSAGGSVQSRPEAPAAASAPLVQAPTPTTLEAECGHVISREAFISHLLEHVEDSYLALQKEAEAHPELSALSAPVRAAAAFSLPVARLIRERWRSRLQTLGRAVRIQQGARQLEGKAEEVNESGELLLRCRSGELVTVTWGDVGHLS